MGSNTSKATNETAVPVVQFKDSELSVSSDPRSPTPEITRTPLQGKSNEKYPITKNADLRKTFENRVGESKLHHNPILSAVIKNHLQFYDPRSPSQEIHRTPIILSNNDENRGKSRLEDKKVDEYGTPYLKETPVDDLDDSNFEDAQFTLGVPKNLCEELFDMTLDNTLKEPVEPLGSSTASQEVIENNISNFEKPSQLLETNFEFVEAKSEDIVEHVNDDSTTEFEVLDNDPRSPSIGIERTPIVVSKTDDLYSNVEQSTEDSLLKVLQKSNSNIREALSKAQGKKLDGLLIYEDESPIVTVTPKKSAPDNNGSRTPLSCMRNKTEDAHVRSLSANNLDVKKIAQKRMSHIPRLKALVKPSQIPQLTSLKTQLPADCENTPPHSHRDIWDKDNSIVL